MKTPPRKDLPTEKLADGVYRLDEFGGTNCYLVVGEREAMLVDCGTGFCDLEGAVRDITSLPLIVVATHGHGDHLGGKGQFERVYLHRDDFKKINFLQSGRLFRAIFVLANPQVRANGFSARSLLKPKYKTELIPMDDGNVFDLGGKIIRVKHTAGHSAGSVALIDETDGLIFSGDNVCDALWLQLPGCLSVEEWLPSAKWLFEASKTHEVYWGHRVPKLDTEYIATVIGWGESLLNGTKRNTLLPRVRQYPKQSDGIIYRTDNVLKKKRK